MKKKGLVIAGFAGIGKTTLGKKYSNVIDVESSPYKWDYSGMDVTDYEKVKGTKNRQLNKNFPQNYIDKIKGSLYKYDIICVWLHPEEIFPAYDKNDIDYVLCFPELDAIEDYAIRFKNRGNNDEFINKVCSNYKTRYDQFMNIDKEKIILKKGETLESWLLKNNYNLIEKEKSK